MNLLLPLGLLGLLSILVLIVIYILKPNYQQKIISSTFVWKLSLKYRKKRIPISRLRNILIIICQILILTGMTLVLTKPVIEGEKLAANEEVMIIDASGSMFVEYDGLTRFERAIERIRTRSTELFEKEGVVSVIVAGPEPYFVAQRCSSENSAVLFDKLDEMVQEETFACTYNSADMERTVEMAQNVVVENPKAEVFLYTGTEYIDTNNIQVVNMAEEDEWNVAILGCTAEYGDDNYYNISVDVGCYNRSEAVTVYCEVFSPNKDFGSSITLESEEYFFSAAEEEQTVVFTSDMQYDQFGMKLTDFEYLYIYVEETDNLSTDNTFYQYGGIKEEIRIQYASFGGYVNNNGTMAEIGPNNFFRSGIIAIREALKDVWDIELDIITTGIDKETGKPNYATEDYDLYIFEHTMPEKMPTDGVVLLVDPNPYLANMPQGSGVRLEGTVDIRGPINYFTKLEAGDPHPLTDGLTPEQITWTKYQKVASHDGYDELLYAGTDPVLLAKNTDEAKIAILTLDLNCSNFPLLKDFPIFLFNLFQYFMPPTIMDFSYEVGDTVVINARGEEISISGGNIETTLTEFPSNIVVEKPGVYTLGQFDISGEYILENFFVSVPNYESYITKQVDSIPLLYVENIIEQEDKDLLVYFAAAIVALLFLEWWLQSREYF